MSIDCRIEKLVTLEDAAQFAPGYKPGKRVSTAAVRRWARYGMRGGKIKLETVMAGGRRCTSREAVQRFFEALTQAREPDEPKERTRRKPPTIPAETLLALRERHGMAIDTARL